MWRPWYALTMLVCCSLALAQNRGERRGEAAAAWADAHSQPSRVAVGDALARVIPALTLEDVPLGEVLGRLSDLSGTVITVEWSSLDAIQVTRDTPISLRTRAVPLKTVLWVVLRQATLEQSLTYVVRGEMIVIASTSAFDRDLITRTYDVNELVTHFRFQIPDLKFWAEAIYGPGSEMQLPRGQARYSDWPSDQREQRMRELARCITSTIEPDHWQENGGRGRISWFDGTLVVYASPRVQQMIGGPLGDDTPGNPTPRPTPQKPQTDFPASQPESDTR